MYSTTHSLTIPIFGIDGAGKSTLAYRLKGDPGTPPRTGWGFSKVNIQHFVSRHPHSKAKPSEPILAYSRCMPFSHDTFAPCRWVAKAARAVTHRMIHIKMYDIGGEQSIRGIWRNYLAECHGCIYVIDAADSGRLGEAITALKEVYQLPGLSGKPVLIDEDPYALYSVSLQITTSSLHSKSQGRRTAPSIWTDRLKANTALTWLCSTIFTNLPNLDERIRLDMLAQQHEWDQHHAEKNTRIQESLIDPALPSQDTAATETYHKSDGKVHPL
ncbi:hypothetical protein BSLG_008459 [Batrachochytrium salamandrivorans]|nr:hypothetical protein BSLG_008459 [Batrachochytrium salamandrivorans]